MTRLAGAHIRRPAALILVAVTPTAGSMAAIAAEYQADPSHASAPVLLTTLLSLIAFPVVQIAFS